MDLYKLALRYSDGMLLSPSYVNQELVDYAHELDIPVVGPVDATSPEASTVVTEFFDSVWSKGKQFIEDPDA
jgi:hypothetical protein